LFRRHGEKFERLDEGLHLSNIAFFGLREASDGRVYAGGPAGLFCFDSGKLRACGEGREVDEVYLIGAAKDGSLWLGTNHGLRVTRRRDMQNVIGKNMIGAILEDHAGSMWLGTEGDGLSLVRNQQVTVFRAPASLPDNSILAILEDREQNIWVGTADGLVRMSAPDVGALNKRDGLSEDNVSTTYCGPGGSLWFTTVTGRVFQYVNGRVEPVHLPPPADLLRIRGTLEDHTGAFWFGTDNQGVVRFANGKATRFTVADGLRNNGIQAFYEDRGQNLWIGTTSDSAAGTARTSRIIISTRVSHGWVCAIAKTTMATCSWARIAPQSSTMANSWLIRPSRALRRDRIWSIYPEPPDTLWVGTRGAGLVRVQNGRASRITTREGLLSNSIFHVRWRWTRHFWMSGPLGLSAASIADLHSAAEGKLESVAVLAYGTGDGLESAQINGGVQPSGCVAPDGELWFPSVKGAVHFKPGHPRTTYHAPARVESVLVDGKAVAATGEIVVDPWRRRVEIEFTACSLFGLRNALFVTSWNFDAHWIAANGPQSGNLRQSASRTISISRDCTRRIAAMRVQRPVSLVVQPHFYQTAWFYALAVLAACAGAAGVFSLSGEAGTRALQSAWRSGPGSHARCRYRSAGLRGSFHADRSGCRLGPLRPGTSCWSLDNAPIHLRLTLMRHARRSPICATTHLRMDSPAHCRIWQTR
jgi:hypothetical protein